MDGAAEALSGKHLGHDFVPPRHGRAMAYGDSAVSTAVHALHAEELPSFHTVYKNYPARFADDSALTELSNVVAYVGRPSRSEVRQHGFLWILPAGDQRFGHQRFSIGQNG
jgi:hypothetical protein